MKSYVLKVRKPSTWETDFILQCQVCQRRSYDLTATLWGKSSLRWHRIQIANKGQDKFASFLVLDVLFHGQKGRYIDATTVLRRH